MIRQAQILMKVQAVLIAGAMALAGHSVNAEDAVILPQEGPVFEVGQSMIQQPRRSRLRCYFRAEALAFKRHDYGSETFATLNGASALSTGDLPYDHRSGGLLVLGCALSDRHTTEVSYFTLNTWEESAAVTDLTPSTVDIGGTPTTINGSLFSRLSAFGNPATVGLDYNNFASIQYSSTLDNLEWNLRYRVDMPPGILETSVLIGGRYMNVREQLGFASDSDAPAAGTVNSVTTRTGNELVGFQMGALFEFQIEPNCWVDCEIKGAIFDNGTDQDTAYVHSGEPTFQGTHVTARKKHRSTFALDLSLMFTYQMGRHLTAHAGYQALWVDGLALASENFNPDAYALMNGPATLITSGKTVYHGPRAGITFMW